MGGNDDADDSLSTFDGYVVTTVNPGRILLLSTVIVCLFFLVLLSCLIIPGILRKKRKDTKETNDIPNLYQIMEDGGIELTGASKPNPISSLAEQVKDRAFEANDVRSKRIWSETTQIMKLGTP
jgi:hypothetical protein